MYVNDLYGAKRVFETYFNAKANREYHNKITDFKSFFLSFDNGTRLEIMNKPNLIEQENNIIRTGYIHIVFSVWSKQKVDVITEQLIKDWCEVISGPRITGDDSRFLRKSDRNYSIIGERVYMYLLLLAVIYLAFISLGLPDSLLGAAWPTVQVIFELPI